MTATDENATVEWRSDRAMSLAITARTMRDMLEDWLNARWHRPVTVTTFTLSDEPDPGPSMQVCLIAFEEHPAELPEAVETDLATRISTAMRAGHVEGWGAGGGYQPPDRSATKTIFAPAVPRDDPDMPDRIASQGA